MSSVLSTAPLVPSLATVNEMLTAVLPKASDPGPSSSQVPGTFATTAQDVTDKFDEIGLLDAAIESRLFIDSSEESHVGG